MNRWDLPVQEQRDRNHLLRKQKSLYERVCVDPGHIACCLSLEDAAERFDLAELATTTDAAADYRFRAQQSLRKAIHYLDECAVGRSPLHSAQGFLSREGIQETIIRLGLMIGNAPKPYVRLIRAHRGE